MMMMMMMMMMMIVVVFGMAERRQAFALIFSRDHCQKSSPSGIFDMPQTGAEPDFRSCAVVVTTTPRRYIYYVFHMT